MDRYKYVNNGKGTDVHIGFRTGNFVSIGPDGKDIMIGCKEKVITFDSLEDMINAIDLKKSS